jgi:hypothetical protein
MRRAQRIDKNRQELEMEQYADVDTEFRQRQVRA